MVEQAGNRLLFKIGEIIGPQSEMYQEKERQNKVENDYNRSYHRKIRVKLPDGYELKNAEDLKMLVTAENEGIEIYKFSSEYNIKNNELIVDIIEFYSEIYFPKEKFEDFRKVINAAADWNKIILVFVEKGQQ